MFSRVAFVICFAEELLYSIDDAISFTQTNIVQAELNERGNFGSCIPSITQHHRPP